MALIKCKSCGNEISDKASKCPSCGTIVSKESKKGLLIGILSFVGVLAFIFLISLFLNKSIIGKWEHHIIWTINGKEVRESYASYTFKNDGTFSYEGYNIDHSDEVKFDGTYTVENDKITVSFDYDGEDNSFDLYLENNILCEEEKKCEPYFKKAPFNQKIIVNRELPHYKDEGLYIDLFYGDGCPHCEEFLNYYNSLDEGLRSQIHFNIYEVWYDTENEKYAELLAEELGVEFSGVPFIVFNNEKYMIGFDSSDSSLFMEIVNYYLEK